MPATLPQIQARLEQAIALRDDAEDVSTQMVQLGASITAEVRGKHEARLNGYQREVYILMKIERDLVADGRASENDLRVLSRFDAPEASAAAKTPLNDQDAPLAPREAPRSDAANASPRPNIDPAQLPAAGDVF